MDPVTQFILFSAALFVLGAASEFLFSQTRVPDVIWLILVGILVGPVTNCISPDLFKPYLPFIGAISIIVILAGSGLKMRLSDVAASGPRALWLGVVGFVFSIAAIFLFMYWMTHLEVIQKGHWTKWILIGSIVAGTSSLVVTPTLERGKVNRRTASFLELESCVTDIFCIVMTMLMIDIVLIGQYYFDKTLLQLVKEVGIGTALGAIGGMLLSPFIPRLKGSRHNYTIFLSTLLILYAVASHFGGNGSISVIIFAVIFGNASIIMSRLIPGVPSESFEPDPNGLVIHDQITFFIKSFFFVLIGVLFPTEPRMILLGAGAAAALLLFRIPAVQLSLMGTQISKQNRALISITIPRGIAAGVLSTLPVSRGIPQMENLSSAVFSTIVFTIIFFSAGFMLFVRPEKITYNQQSTS